MMKKLSMVMAVVMLCVSCLCITASADTEATANTLKVTAVSQEVETGQEFALSVDFSENTGFNTLGVKLTYPEGFAYVPDSAAPSELIAEKCYLNYGGYSGETYVFYFDETARTITFIGASLYDITDESGTLFTAKFTAPTAATSDAAFTVEIIDESYNEDGDSVTATPENGAVDVTPPYVLGDVNGDNKVNARDALRVLRYRLDSTLYPLTDEQMLRADMRQDGKVNERDALAILKYELEN